MFKASILFALALALAASPASAEIYQLKARYDCARIERDKPLPAWLEVTTTDDDGVVILGKPPFLSMVRVPWHGVVCLHIAANRIAAVADDTFAASYEPAK